MEPLTPRPRQKEEICRHHGDDHRGVQYDDHDYGQNEDHVRMEPLTACLLQYVQCHHYDIDHEVFCLAIHKSRFFWPDCVRMKIKFERTLLIELKH